jgi:hypothetical protein
MKYEKKFISSEKQQQVSQTQAQSQTMAKEFNSVDEMLRFDAKQTVVPPEIAQRLDRSVQNEPSHPRQPWWRRLLG